MQAIWSQLEGRHNFVFVGEAGSGKSEIAISFAKQLAQRTDKTVHFFDLDMTKPLFRSRDVEEELSRAGVQVHYQEQFMDAPTLVGGVMPHLRDENCLVVLDVGGDYIGARSIGGFAPQLNKPHTAVFYVINSYRPWSDNIDHIDGTLGPDHYVVQQYLPDALRDTVYYTYGENKVEQAARRYWEDIKSRAKP